MDHLKQLGVELVLADLAQPADLAAAVRDVDVVYHLAGKICDSAEIRTDASQRRGHGAFGGRLCVPEQAARLHSRVVGGSRRPRAQGPSANGDGRRRAVSNYGRSKLAGEIAVEALADRLPATVVRPGIVFGPRDRETFLMFSAIRNFRCHLIPGLRSPRLSLIHVEDLVEMLLLAADRGARLAPRSLEHSRPGRGCYFACSPEFPTYAKLGGMIARALHCRIVLPIFAPYPLPWLIAGGNQLLSRLRGHANSLNVNKIREARAASWACSPEAALRNLGFAPRKSLADRLNETVQWYYQEGWL